MITPKKIGKILSSYDLQELTIGTLGSHSALNIFKGAKEEDLKTVCVCKKEDKIMYERFHLADKIIVVEHFRELLDEKLQEQLRNLNTVLVPHGSFTAYLSTEQLTNDLYVPMFGNRMLLHWEASRTRQENWLRNAGLRLPKTYKTPEEISGLAIAKLPGAKGGRGYFLVSSKESFKNKVEDMVLRGLLAKKDVNKIHLQEYILGVNVYPHYFSSIVNGEVELTGTDRRYESAVDTIGRIPAADQTEIGINPTYTIVGNFPLTLRESLIPELIRMGGNVTKEAARLAPPGIIGPFCLETVITDSLEIFTFEISARIVAGTNVGIGTSPYAYLKYGPNMYVGRRIAVEIKEALHKGRASEVLA